MLENTPSNGIVPNIERTRTRKPSITFVVDSRVVSPLLFRNSSDERAETIDIDGQTHAQANPEKFTSKERLTGLDLLRQLSEEYENLDWSDFEAGSDEKVPDGLISSEYLYNQPDVYEDSINHDCFTYGVVGTGSDDYAIKSRVTEGYTFSMKEYDIMNTESRNSAFETGTMKDEDSNQSQNLYQRVNIQPNNRFLRFVTIESATLPMVVYVLHNILNTGNYGARETRAGKTINNSILGIITSKHLANLSTAEYLFDYADDDDVYAGLGDYLQDVSRGDWSIYSDQIDGEEIEELPEWYSEIKSLALREDEEKLYEILQSDLQKAYESIHGDNSGE